MKSVARSLESVFVVKDLVGHVATSVCPASTTTLIVNLATVQRLEALRSLVTTLENVTVWPTLLENSVQVAALETINTLNVFHVIAIIMVLKVSHVMEKVNVHVNPTLTERHVISVMKVSTISQLVRSVIVIRLV